MYYHHVPLSSSHSPALVTIVFPIKARSELHSNHLVELTRVEAAGMAKFVCAHCEHTYAHRRNLTYHMKSKHPDVSVEMKVRGAGMKVKTGLQVSSVINMGTCLQSVEVWIDMSQGIIQIIQHSTVVSVESRIPGLVIWRCIK